MKNILPDRANCTSQQLLHCMLHVLQSHVTYREKK